MLVRKIKSDIFIFRLPKFRQFFKSYLDHRIGRGLFTVATSMFLNVKKYVQVELKIDSLKEVPREYFFMNIKIPFNLG